MKNDINIKNIDALGRIVIPSTIRKKLGINQDTMLSFQLNDDSIVLKKIHSLEESNSEVLLKLLEKITENEVLIVDLEKVVLSSNKKYLNQTLTLDFRKVLEKRQKRLDISLQFLSNLTNESNLNVYPIIKNSNLYGAIVILLQNSSISKKNNEIIELVVKLYTESCF